MDANLEDPLFPVREESSVATLVLELSSFEGLAAEMVPDFFNDLRRHHQVEGSVDDAGSDLVGPSHLGHKSTNQSWLQKLLH